MDVKRESRNELESLGTNQNLFSSLTTSNFCDVGALKKNLVPFILKLNIPCPEFGEAEGSSVGRWVS